ncbi:flagellar protein FlaG [Idiomarina seosinensis]|uniref:flagellar protein FlaG n=1 Tax=Idiomarina seosinensis TaxID=281739 RepID=UPI00384F2B2A
MGEFTISSRDVLRSNAGNAADPISGRGQLREQVMGAVKAVQQQANAAPPADAVKEGQASAQTSSSAAAVAEQIEQLNQSQTIRNTSLQFVMQENNEPPVVQVVDQDSGDVIRQIPSEVAVKIAKAIDELVDTEDSRSGFLFDSNI